MKPSTKTLLGTMALGVTLVAFGGEATAGLLTLHLSANGSPVTTVQDGDANDTLAANHQVGYSGTVGGFGTTVTVGTSNEPGSNGASGANVNLTNTQIANPTGSAGTINIGLSDADFTMPSPATQLNSALSATYVGKSRSNQVSFASSADDSNILFGTSSSAPTLNLSGNGATSGSTGVSLTGPYSLTSNLALTVGAGNVATITGNTSVVVPEPASLALLGLGGLTLITRRRRRV